MNDNSRTLHDILRTLVLFGSDATRGEKDAYATKQTEASARVSRRPFIARPMRRHISDNNARVLAQRDPGHCVAPCLSPAIRESFLPVAQHAGTPEIIVPHCA
ncbi:hypothetical protein L0Y81_29805 [Burkholderia multivorans]|uniref:hypothetical protein n=1 Tax=Burkholderia multivorans TaxID=87883 RepID=UPI0015E275E9|nr:hypothetical protein [Burkholderia multivorans]UQN90222.1 hypothetical protein L0Y85_29810 [Burkholderia multivorans]UQO75410.1 hypothetical protein L0Y81_29805 [Burkholderia multivorans]UQP41174.1 hypothetical protein L0Z03_29800 [Burkholderia multivorans]